MLSSPTETAVDEGEANPLFHWLLQATGHVIQVSGHVNSYTEPTAPAHATMFSMADCLLAITALFSTIVQK